MGIILFVYFQSEDIAWYDIYLGEVNLLISIVSVVSGFL